MKVELDSCSYAPIGIPVVSSITGNLYTSEREIPEQLAIQLVSPVRWTQVLACLAEGGMRDLIEVGPQTVLRNLSLTNRLDLTVYGAENRRDFQEIVRLFSAVRKLEAVKESSRYQLINDCLKEAVCAPNSNFNEKEFEQGVLIPYRQVLSGLKNLEKEGRLPSYREMRNGLDMLLQVLLTKKVAKAECKEIVEEVLLDSGLFDCYHEYLDV